jgi:hypothetical protein
MVDTFRFAFDEAWQWAERREVRVDFWRNEAYEWEARVTLRDIDGAFSSSSVIPLYAPTRADKRKHTIEELRAMYVGSLRSMLDGLTVKARKERNKFQLRRLQYS